jgi:hypothetical protein
LNSEHDLQKPSQCLPSTSITGHIPTNSPPNSPHPSHKTRRFSIKAENKNPPVKSETNPEGCQKLNFLQNFFFRPVVEFHLKDVTQQRHSASRNFDAEFLAISFLVSSLR